MEDENVIPSRDENFDTYVEHSVIAWMNEQQTMRREPHNIHVTELNHCLLMSAGDRLFEVVFEDLADLNMMFIGICLEDSFAQHEFLANIYPSEVIKKKIPKSDTILIGEIDIDTARRGIFEIKSKESFWGLPSADRMNIPQLINVEVCGSPRIYNKAPATSHIDQSNSYVMMKNSSLSHIIYFSRTSKEGIAPYTMRYTRDDVSKIREILYERGVEYDEAITEAFQYSDMATIVRILNEKLVPEPSGLCAYCIYGGTLSNKYRNGRKSGLKNFCPIKDLSVRYGFTRVHTVIPKELYLNTDLRAHIYRSIIGLFRERYLPRVTETPPLPPIDTYRFEILFFCPRLSNYIVNKYDLIYGIGITEPGLFPYTTAQIAIHFNRLAIVEKLNEILNPPVLIEGEKKQQYQIVEFESSGKVRKKFLQLYPVINGYPTHIIPSARIRARKKEQRPPYEDDLIHIGTAQALTEKDFRLCYYPIKGATVASFSLDFKEEIDLEILRMEMNERVDKIFAVENGEPIPKIWCLWCPVRYLSDETGKSLCPKGAEYIQKFFEERKRAGRTSEADFTVNIEEVVTDDEPFPYLDDMGKF